MAETYVVLRNKDRFRLFQCTLYHSIVCTQRGECICVQRERTEADRKGEFYLAERSLFLPPKQTSEPLPREVMEVPQVKKGLDDGLLEHVSAPAPIEVVVPRRRPETFETIAAPAPEPVPEPEPDLTPPRRRGRRSNRSR